MNLHYGRLIFEAGYGAGIEGTDAEKAPPARHLGGCHTAFDELPKSLPKHLRGQARKAAEELISEGFLMLKQTSYGLHVSLNPQRKADIDRIISEVLGD